jgi:hypothetical protein
MADPLTILSAVSASSQIAEHLIAASLAIYNFCLKIQRAPQSIRKQIMHVEQLTSIARLIIQNPGLQTDSVASVLETCLREVEELRRLLEKSLASERSHVIKFQKAFFAVMNEKKVIALFQRLEREKVSLTLCIQEVDS